jgi:hypothetical protein
MRSKKSPGVERDMSPHRCAIISAWQMQDRALAAGMIAPTS